ncbi:ribbon-helix-helix domain-containing protein [Pontivivens ytuae]|uniref:Ribbon-helix-helix domain-containing protein n=1 Tax=Pontivivens ytuae TaxID=2789856 RepID=A0A7S9QEA2_9RHOB|nr:ribbon-helix-helix domain-containing protein [Pontivivens ytuae]QPH54981.1 ribbon-helix-helix domain-containing protein [Pontivivens ytuae]
MSRPEKHSVTLRGHRTSISLEPEFWAAFRAIAARRGVAINALVSQIDESRDPETGLASAIRVFVLADAQDLSAERSSQDSSS